MRATALGNAQDKPCRGERDPFVRILLGVAAFAVIVGVAMVALPVILGVMAFCFAAGLLYWLYLKFTGKLSGAASMEETIRESMDRAEAESRSRYEYEERVEVGMIETSDKKRWKMNDVEDIEESPKGSK